LSISIPPQIFEQELPNFIELKLKKLKVQFEAYFLG